MYIDGVGWKGLGREQARGRGKGREKEFPTLKEKNKGRREGSFRRRSSQPLISWRSTEETKPTQQKQTIT